MVLAEKNTKVCSPEFRPSSSRHAINYAKMHYLLSTLLCGIILTPSASAAPYPDTTTSQASEGLSLEGKHKSYARHEHEILLERSAFSDYYNSRKSQQSSVSSERQLHASTLTKAYLYTMNDIGVETFIMHSSLLGWYRNRKILPWDLDVHVQMPEKSMQHLADFYNMTIHRFELPDYENSHEFLLQISPHWADVGVAAFRGVDARWLDLTTEQYIDIAVLHYEKDANPESAEASLICEGKYHYKYADIFPLQESTFEGMLVRIPFAHEKIIKEEFGMESISDAGDFHRHLDIDLQGWGQLSN